MSDGAGSMDSSGQQTRSSASASAVPKVAMYNLNLNVNDILGVTSDASGAI